MTTKIKNVTDKSEIFNSIQNWVPDTFSADFTLSHSKIILLTSVNKTDLESSYN